LLYNVKVKRDVGMPVWQTIWNASSFMVRIHCWRSLSKPAVWSLRLVMG
jgi:hypothetical protein